MKKIFAILVVSGLVFSSCSVLKKSKDYSEKREVTGVKGALTLHPDSVAYTGSDGALYCFFLVLESKCIFVSKAEGIYKKFSEHLPETVVPGRYIVMEGATINPFTLFSKDQLEEEGRRIGVQLNDFKVAKLFNYGLFGGDPVPVRIGGATSGPLDQFIKGKKN